MWYVATLDRANELLDAGYKVIIEEEIYSERP